jgi:hypothetical protein
VHEADEPDPLRDLPDPDVLTGEDSAAGCIAYSAMVSRCAFSNQKGGTLFIGVSKEGDIEGLASHAGSAWR